MDFRDQLIDPKGFGVGALLTVLKELRAEGYALKQDRPAIDRTLIKGLSPIPVITRPWFCSDRSRTIVVVDNDEKCIQSVLKHPSVRDMSIVGLYSPQGVDPLKTVQMAYSLGSLVVLDGAEYVDDNCAECNEANIKAHRLNSMGAKASVSIADPRLEMCGTSLLSGAHSLAKSLD